MKLIIIISSLLIAGCITKPPRDINNLCSIFKQYPQWYRDTKSAEQRWHIPIAVQMAIIHQESKFDARAEPRRTKLLWFIPWKIPSSAYGYSQALRSTWISYKQTRRISATREDFSAAVDFVGWYANLAYKNAGISPKDSYNLYLAYHEGIGGYRRKTYLKKSWLMHVAKKVRAREEIYRHQMIRCQKI